MHTQLFRVFLVDGMHEEYYRSPASVDKRGEANWKRFSADLPRYNQNSSLSYQLPFTHRLREIEDLYLYNSKTYISIIRDNNKRKP